jgi:hypothetical protein
MVNFLSPIRLRPNSLPSTPKPIQSNRARHRESVVSHSLSYLQCDFVDSGIAVSVMLGVCLPESIRRDHYKPSLPVPGMLVTYSSNPFPRSETTCMKGVQ